MPSSDPRGHQAHMQFTFTQAKHPHPFLTKNCIRGEMAQKFRALGALPKDPGSVLSILMAAQAHSHLQFKF